VCQEPLDLPLRSDEHEWKARSKTGKVDTDTAKRMYRPDGCADTQQLVGQTSGIELLHGSRMEAEGAAQVGFAVASLQHPDTDSGPGEITRQQEPGRASPNHKNVYDWCPMLV
jgi:hypothetical protein